MCVSYELLKNIPNQILNTKESKHHQFMGLDLFLCFLYILEIIMCCSFKSKAKTELRPISL